MFVQHKKKTFLCVIEFKFFEPQQQRKKLTAEERTTKLAAKCIEINEISIP